MTRFRSRHHPGPQPRLLLAAQAQAKPVALGLLALFTVALVAVLRGHPILVPLAIALPLVYAAAAAYGMHGVHRTPAEVVVDGAFASVASVWEAASPHEPPPPLMPVFSARFVRGEFLVGVGDTIHVFRPEDWPEFDSMADELRDAAAQGATFAITV